MSVGGSGEVAWFADERPCDDSSYCVLSAHYFACLPANVVQFFKRDYLFVSCDLENAVSGRIDDELSCLHVFFAVIPDDIRAAVGLVAEEFLARCLFELSHDVFRKAVRISGLGFVGNDTSYFPVPDRGILAGRYLADPRVRTDG